MNKQIRFILTENRPENVNIIDVRLRENPSGTISVVACDRARRLERVLVTFKGGCLHVWYSSAAQMNVDIIEEDT